MNETIASDHRPATIDLITRAQEGETEASNHLWSRFYASAIRHARLRMGAVVLRDFEPGDIVQRALAVAVTRLRSFEPRHTGSFRRWLKTIIENQIRDAVDWQRRSRRHRRRPLAGRSDDPGNDVAREPLPAPGCAPTLEAVEGNERLRILEQCISEMKSPYGDVIRARAEGRSWVWIARHLGRPSPDAARMMHVAARAALCKALRERGVLG